MRHPYIGRSLRWLAVTLVVAALCGAQSTAQVVTQLTDFKHGVATPGVLDDAGTVVYSAMSSNQLGNNTDYSFEIFKFDAVTGAGTMITDLRFGLAADQLPERDDDALPVIITTSDDGQWLAFLSNSDPFGTNHEQNAELFVIQDDGTSLAQLTSDTSPNAGSVTAAAIDGSGTRIAYCARQNPLGSNPNRYTQVFVINRDGTGHAQLTSFNERSDCPRIAISDAGDRIVFQYDGNPTCASCGNADNNYEIFAINGNGTGLRQLTSDPDFGSVAPAFSGNGQKIAFQSRIDPFADNVDNEIETFVVNYDGTGLIQLIDSVNSRGNTLTGGPAITDDGVFVFFFSNDTQATGGRNSDGNAEIVRIRSDGTDAQPMTDTLSLTDPGHFFPSVSGDGSRMTFLSTAQYFGISDNLDANAELYVKDDAIADGSTSWQATLVQLSDGLEGWNRDPVMTADGSLIAFISRADLLGLDPDRGGEVYSMNSDGTGMVQITSLPYSDRVEFTSISSDGEWIAFVSDEDDAFVAPENGNATSEVFVIRSDGTDLLQLSKGPVGKRSINPVVCGTGSWVYWDSNDNQLDPQNADGSREIWRSSPLEDPNNADRPQDLQQMTDDPNPGVDPELNPELLTISRKPRCIPDGSVFVFESNSDFTGSNGDGSFEVFRFSDDGSLQQQITTGGAGVDSFAPDISSDGNRIAYMSATDPLATNADGNFEIFLYDLVTTTTTQVTDSTEGTSVNPRISPDGRWIFFLSNAPLLDDDPDRPYQAYRYDTQTGLLERVGGRPSSSVRTDLILGNDAVPSPSEDGQLIAFSARGNFTGENPDIEREIWFVDYTVYDPIVLSGPAPTTVTWSYRPAPLRYDVIRGDLDSISSGGPGIVDLGTVVCLEDDSVDNDTVGFEDTEDPVPGSGFFYVLRGSQGTIAGPGSYGESTTGGDRQPSSGDCSP
jgi:Tol biopolymer transport system component